GKTHWRRHHAGSQPVISLDEIRAELGVDPAADQSRVRQLAKERAREHLRNGQSFVWDATNLEARRRKVLIDLALDYHARVRIVAIETDPARVEADNAARPRPVPHDVLEGMLSRWQAPDLTEAHELRWEER
ncbi:MAG: ATP-binding protein, partial [Polyangiaceae bacterium]